MRPLLQRAFALVCAVVLALAAYWAARFALADFLAGQSSPAQLAAAVRLAPGNAAYLQRWADLADEAGQPAGNAYERAALLDPYDSSLRIRTGLRAESARDFARAERDLLLAARVDRLYEPRWTLANFYFRRGDAGRFWPWAKSALQWAYGDRRPLFDLCWIMTSNPAALFNDVIPDTPSCRRDYLAYLLEHDRLDAAEAVAASLAAAAGPGDRDPLLNYTNRMLTSQRWESALAVWNRLSQRRLLPYAPLDPASGRSLTNAGFQFDSLAAGFDWRIPDVAGVTFLRRPSPPALRFTFSGKQPEQCEVLEQWLPVLPGAAYRLSFDYQTAGVEPESGLQWKVFDGAPGIELQAFSPQWSSPEWRTSAAGFTVPPGVRALRLVLNYRRMPGTVRIQGEAWLRNLRLERAP